MENWKLAIVAGAAGAGALLLLKGKKSAGLACTGIGLATLASEYPEEFRTVRDNFHEYVEHGAVLLDVASRIGERIAEASDSSASGWYRVLAG
jgi:hypothetical protein